MKTLPLLKRGAVVLVVMTGALISVGAAIAQPPSTNVSTAAAQWRRTNSGWERADLWELQPRERTMPAGDAIAGTAPAPLPSVHPLIVASLMFAAAGLLAIGPRS